MLQRTQCELTFLVIVHPVKHDLGSPPVPRGDIASHNLSFGSGQTKVQDLDFTVLTHTHIAGLQILQRGEMGLLGMR